MLRLSFTAPTDSDGDGLLDEEGGAGRRVTLRTDPTQATFDRYDRLLAYVTTRAGVNLGARQVADGWAKVYVFGGKPFQQVDRFMRAERRARARGRGVWSLCGGNFHTPA
jgi:endonuclease YncB( thermonuclease family)